MAEREREREMARRVETRNELALTRAVGAVFAFVRYAEFEILFFLFFVIAYIVFKDIVTLSLSLSVLCFLCFDFVFFFPYPIIFFV